MMRFKYRIPFVLALCTSIFSAGSAQVLLEHKELTVPQQCALRIIEEPVAKQLNLTPAQSSVYKTAVKEYLATSEKLDAQKLPKEADRIACDKKFADSCLGTLNETQKHKILQIGIKSIGMFALTDPSIAAQVGLNALQVHKVKEICRDFAKKDEDVSAMIANALETIPEPKAGADRTAYDKKRVQTAEMYNGERQRINRERANSEKRIVALMTPPQQKKWIDLVGPTAKK